MAFYYNQRKPRQFNHQYIYYDEQKAEMAKRIEKAKQELAMSEDPTAEQVKANLRGSLVSQSKVLRRNGGSSRSTRIGSGKSFLFIIALILVALLIFYFYF